MLNVQVRWLQISLHNKRYSVSDSVSGMGGGGISTGIFKHCIYDPLKKNSCLVHTAPDPSFLPLYFL